MSLICQSEIHVQTENALRFSLVTKPPPVLDYVKAISSVVGATHILAVFEETDNLKVYFDDKRYVDAVIRSGIHVLGRHVRIDYVVPPGVKVILSNVDPVLSNCDILHLLADYGTVVSPIIRIPISDDAEVCHIGYGVVHAYMLVNELLPTKVEFKCGDQVCCIKLKVEDKPEPFILPCFKEDPDETSNDDELEINTMPAICDGSVSNTSRTDANTVEISEPVVVSVEGATSVSTNQIAISESFQQAKTFVPKRRGRPKKASSRHITASVRAAKRIKNIKHKLKARRRHFKKQSEKKNDSVRIETSPGPPDLEVSSQTTVSAEQLEPTYTNVTSPLKPNYSSSILVLEPQKLLMFLDEVKHHRAPLELARKYLGEECNNVKLFHLIQQLHVYNKSHSDLNLKMRISRIIKHMKDSM